MSFLRYLRTGNHVTLPRIPSLKTFEERPFSQSNIHFLARTNRTFSNHTDEGEQNGDLKIQIASTRVLTDRQEAFSLRISMIYINTQQITESRSKSLSSWPWCRRLWID